MADPTPLEQFEARAKGIGEWLAENAPYVTGDQKHLDANTPGVDPDALPKKEAVTLC